MRPQLITDAQGLRLRDPISGSYVGWPAPFGRDRIVNALPLNGTGPVLLTADGVIIDAAGLALADPVSGAMVGIDGVWVHRMLAAGTVEDTRRL